MQAPFVDVPGQGRITHGQPVPGMLSKRPGIVGTPIHALVQPYGFGLFDELGNLVAQWQAAQNGAGHG